MKRFVKFCAFLVCSVMVFSLGACITPDPNPTPPTPTEYKVEVNDFTLELGLSETITPKMTPLGTQAIYAYSVETATPTNCVTISNGIAQAHEEGTATFKVTATNLPSATETFSVTDTFTVTVEAPELEEGNLIVNGGFENAFYGWELEYPDEDSSFKNEVTDNTPHGGVSALNLWSKVGATEGEADPLDLTISQEVSVTEAGDYLFSLWFKGSIQTMIFTVLDEDDEEVATGSFEIEEYASFAMSEHEDYINLGIDVEDLSVGTYTVKLQFLADWTNNWGFVDDISLSKGSTEDLLRPVDPEAGQYNFIVDGNISTDYASHWTNAGTSEISRGTSGGAHISCWGTDFNFYQMVSDLPKRDYSFVVKAIGPGGSDYRTPTESYIYVAGENGTIIEKQDFTLPGYSWTRLSLDDVELEGTVRVGVVIKFSQDTWAGFTGFVLFSDGYTHTASNKTDFTNIKVDGIDVNEENVVTLPYARYAKLVEAKADAKTFVSGSLASKASVTSAVFDEDSGVLTVVVTAEDGTTTKTYEITVLAATGDTRQEVEVSLLSADWEYDADVAGSLIGFSSGIEFPNNKNNVGDTDPSDLVLSQTLTGVAQGAWKIVVVYSHEHATIDVNGATHVEGWEGIWAWTSDAKFEVDVEVDDSGEVEIELTIMAGTWSYLKISSITLVPVIERQEVEVSLLSADWEYDADVAGSLIGFSSGIEFPNNKNNVGDTDPSDLVLSQTLTGVAQGAWKIVVVYSHEHATIDVNGATHVEGWEGIWAWTSDAEFEVDVEVDDSGEVEIELTIKAGTWSYLKISSITLVPVEAA